MSVSNKKRKVTRRKKIISQKEIKIIKMQLINIQGLFITN